MIIEKYIDEQFDQVIRNAVARYRLSVAEILKGTDIKLSNPFPLYYPGMPAYDAAKAVQK